MNRPPDAREGGVALEPEAREEHLEGHSSVDVSELGAVEVEADGLLGPIARTVDPDEAGAGVDEAANEPGARHAIHPQLLPRRPDAVLVRLPVQRPEVPEGGTRLAARVLEAALGGGQRVLRLSLGGAWKEIGRREPCEGAPQSFEHARSGGRRELLQQGPVVRGAVEELAHLLELFRT